MRRYNIPCTIYSGDEEYLKKLQLEEQGINREGWKLTKLKHANDIVHIANNIAELKEMPEEFQ